MRGLGVERFGLLTLVSVVIGYFGLFDLGLGRSLTKFVAERAGDGDEVGALVWTALALLLALSLVGSVAVAFAARPLVYDVLKVSDGLRGEAIASLRLLALAIPATFAGNGLKGVLEAHGRFDLTNAVRGPIGILNFAGPLAVLHFSRSLFAVTSVLVTTRFVTCGFFLWMCLAIAPALRRRAALDLSRARQLLRLGSWMTVSNVVGPLIVYLDRFVIGAVASAAVVAYYTTPFEMVSRILVVPLALTGVLFPMFARDLADERSRGAAGLFRGLRYDFLALFPPVVLAVVLAREGLAVWLGADFARSGATVLQCLAVGFFVNSLAQIALAMVQADGRADLTAKLHVVELPLYAPALWLAIREWGVTGAAVAWTGRALLDAVATFAFVWHLLPGSRQGVRRLAAAVLAAVAVLAIGATLPTTSARVVFAAAVLVAFGGAAWRVALTPEERAWLRRPGRFGAVWPTG